ncbi:MAG: hypothetical protein AAFW89_08935 [Bacteroidota bacterium]
MNKSVIIKLLIFLIVPPLVFVVAAYFLFPYLNSAKHEEAVAIAQMDPDSLAKYYPELAGIETDSLTADSLGVMNDSTWTAPEKLAGLSEVDSLYRVIDYLEYQIDSLVNREVIIAQEMQRKEEEFTSRVKSLLNLEEDQLGPILEKMNNEQLLRLYTNGSSTQREKILRVVKPAKAAQLIAEIM